MKIRILGTATSQGIPVIGCDCKVCTSKDERDQRFRSACLVEVNGKTIVIDVGPDFRQQMLKSGGQEVHAILLTHEHNDHVAGLDDVRPFNFRYNKDMPVYGQARVLKHIQHRFDYIFEHQPYPGAPQVTLHPIDENHPFTIEGIDIIPIQVLHGQLPILGYRIGNFAYLTDLKTLPTSEFDKLQDLEVLIVSALQDQEHHSHQTLEDALALAEQIGAKQTYLTHFSHRLGTHKEIESRVSAPVFAGFDGLEIKI